MTRAAHLHIGLKRLALTLMVVAVAARMLVPQGWMPSRAPGQIITICTGVDGMTRAVLGKDGKLHKLPDGEEHKKSDNPCAFAGMATAVAMPDVPVADLAPLAATQIAHSVQNNVTVGRGLAAPPPPSTGPPVLI